MTKAFTLALVAGAAAVLALAPAESFAAMPAGASIGTSHDSAIVEIAARKKMTRREEADKSVRDGTVPARYRRDVPKQYHQYIPFAKQ